MTEANEIYIGNTVSLKCKVRSYRDSSTVYCDKNDWIRVENTHTPIIDECLWQTVQRINNDAKERFSDSREPQQSHVKEMVGFITLDEDKVSSVISTSEFAEAMKKNEVQRLEIADRLSTLIQTVEQMEVKLGDINKWINLIKEKSTINKVDRDLLESLIEKIDIDESSIVNPFQ